MTPPSKTQNEVLQQRRRSVLSRRGYPRQESCKCSRTIGRYKPPLQISAREGQYAPSPNAFSCRVARRTLEVSTSPHLRKMMSTNTKCIRGHACIFPPPRCSTSNAGESAACALPNLPRPLPQPAHANCSPRHLFQVMPDRPNFVRASFGPPLINFLGRRGLTVRSGPKSSVALSATYVDERVRWRFRRRHSP